MHLIEQPIPINKRLILDKWGVGFSSLCLLHCVITVALVAFFSAYSVTWFFSYPIAHILVLVPVVSLVLLQLPQMRKARMHSHALRFAIMGLVLLAAAFVLPHELEPILTIVGSACIARAHYLNLSQTQACEAQSARS